MISQSRRSLEHPYLHPGISGLLFWMMPRALSAETFVELKRTPKKMKEKRKGKSENQ
jgi:hypothetical protein